MANAQPNRKTRQSEASTRILTTLLERLSHGENPRLLRKEAVKLVSSIAPGQIAAAERNLIHEGYSIKRARQLLRTFVVMGILEGSGSGFRAKLRFGHILRKVTAEHDMIRCFIVDLRVVVRDIEVAGSLTDVSSQYRRLSHIIEHLDAAVEHFQREDEVIFPTIRRHGCSGLCRSAQCEHSYFKVAIDDLVRLVNTYDEERYSEFIIRLKFITLHFCRAVMDHFAQEEEILFPIAIEIITDPKVWLRMKAVCDEIGYCGVHV